MNRYYPIWFLLFFVLSSVSSLAQTLHVVTNATDDDINSLRNVINIAQGGDTIFFGSTLRGDTLKLDSSQILISKDLTIIAFPDTSLTISAADSSRIFDIQPAVRFKICFLNLISGNSELGGGINNKGICNLYRIRIAHCKATFGGAIYNDSLADLFIIESTLEKNVAQSDGGAIINLGDIACDRSTISENEAIGLHGGGISHISGSCNFVNSTISGNTCRKFGGGIYNASNTQINHVTIVHNNAERGGGIFNVFQNGFITGSHSLLALNEASIAGPNIHDPNGTDVVSNGYNLIGDISFLSSAIGSVGDIFGFPNNPIDPLVGPLQFNGGYTKTHELLCFSPAINKGDSIGTQLIDQQGLMRNFDGRMDIGAFELQEDSCEIIGSINILSSIPDIQIHPNPSNGLIHLEYLENNSVKYYQIFSIDGRFLGSGNTLHTNQINLTSLNAGLYLIQLEINGLKLIKKLIISK